MLLPVALKGDNELLETIYQNGSGGVNDALLQRYAGGFDKSISNVFERGKSYPKLEKKLRLNASRFGTYKAYDLGKKLDALRSLPKEEFEMKAKSILNAYNGYQKTEYNTLTARSRTAKQWQQFLTEKDFFPNIEWLRTRSAVPRELHLGYEGLVLPQDDEFWINNQPGNEYGCKCDWRTTDKPATGRPTEGETIKPAKGLEGNPGETGELVTEQHPYYTRNVNAPGWVEDKSVLRCNDNTVFTETATGSGGVYREHLLVAREHEAAENRIIAALLADKGFKDVTLLPQIYKTETGLRKRYFGVRYVDEHPTANPDAKVNGLLLEFKSASRRNMSRRVLEGAKKSDRVLLKISEPITDTELQLFVTRQWAMADRKNMSELIIYINNDLKTFKRP